MDSAEFAVDASVVRRALRRFRWALLVYVLLAAGTVALTVWTAGRGLAALLFAATAIQLVFFTAVIVARIVRTRRMLRGERLVVSADGFDDGTGLVPWARVHRIRLRRIPLPRLILVLHTGPKRRRWYNVNLYGRMIDDIAAALSGHVDLVDPDRPRPPSIEDDSVTFFVSRWQLRAYLRLMVITAVEVLAMALPLIAGFLLLDLAWAAGVVDVVTLVLLYWWWFRYRRADRSLRILTGRGRGRLVLNPRHLIWVGTDAPIEWSHVHDVTVTDGRVVGVFTCHDPDHTCRWRDRRRPFTVEPRLYATTVDTLVTAFGRYTSLTS